MNRYILLFFILCTTLQLSAQQIDSLTQQRIIWRLDSLQNSYFLQHGNVSACIKSLRTGATVLAYHHRKSVPPASTMKLITTATAMAVLNENYTYTTTLEALGTIRNDTLYGSIYIRGTGDPSLGGGRFKTTPILGELISNWQLAVQNRGIRVVTGKIIGDGSLFDTNPIPAGWPWEDLGNYYGAGVSGLNINENRVRLAFQSGQSLGDSTTLLYTEPRLAEYSFENRVTTEASNTGDRVNSYASPLGKYFFLEGTIPQRRQEFNVMGALPNPSLTAASVLYQRLTEKGIVIQNGVDFLLKTESPSALPIDTLWQGKSPVLKDLATECNVHSLNLYAETFIRTLGVTLGFGNSTPAGIRALESVWQSKGVHFSGFKVKDGSGLSPQSVLTPDNLTDILLAVSRETYFQSFYQTIPIVGQQGTVKNLGKGTKAAGNVRAKSGSIGGVRTYAGYFTGKNGEQYCFAVHLQQYDSLFGSATRELEKFMVMMINL